MSGYTKVSNDVLDSLISANLSGAEFSCALLVYRKTIGWNQESDTISLSQFTDAVGVTRKAVCNALEVLKLVKIITLVKKGNQNHTASEFKFNEDVSVWELVKKNTLVKKTSRTSVKNFQELVKKTTPSKETTKDTITKERVRTPKKVFGDDSEEMRLAKGLYGCIKTNNPNAKEPSYQLWALEFNKILRVDGRTFEECKEMIKWVQRDEFWHRNILSPPKLREKWDRLFLEMRQKKKNPVVAVFNSSFNFDD